MGRGQSLGHNLVVDVGVVDEGVVGVVAIPVRPDDIVNTNRQSMVNTKLSRPRILALKTGLLKDDSNDTYRAIQRVCNFKVRATL